MASPVVIIGALLTMANDLVRGVFFTALIRLCAFRGLLTSSIVLLEVWHLHMALPRAIVTPLLDFSPTPGPLAAGPMDPILVVDFIYIPLAPAPTNVVALFLITAVTLAPTVAPLALSTAEVVTPSVPAFLETMALLLRRVMLKWEVVDEILVLILPPPVPNCVVPWLPSDATYMALLLSRIRCRAIESMTNVFVTTFSSRSSTMTGATYCSSFDGNSSPCITDLKCSRCLHDRVDRPVLPPCPFTLGLLSNALTAAATGLHTLPVTENTLPDGLAVKHGDVHGPVVYVTVGPRDTRWLVWTRSIRT